MNDRFVTVTLFVASFVAAPARAQSPSVAEQYLLQAANAERVQRGLSVLHWDATLYHAALGHAQQMAARKSISHQYPGEPELAVRGEAAGAHFSLIAENVAEASTAVLIHNAWMNSPGHRANLLSPNVDAVGISVLQRDGQLYAVQDFERTVPELSLTGQEEIVARQLVLAGPVAILSNAEDARRTCALATGYAGSRQPTFVMRYTSADLSHLPKTLAARIATGRYREALIGACEVAGHPTFRTFSIAVLLYP